MLSSMSHLRYLCGLWHAPSARPNSPPPMPALPPPARCLRHAYCRGSRGVARDVRVLGGRWGIDFPAIRCR